MTALGFVLAGVVVNRWKITLSGLVAPPQWSPGVLGNVVAASYFPSLVEFGVAAGIVAYALLGFTWACVTAPSTRTLAISGPDLHITSSGPGRSS